MSLRWRAASHSLICDDFHGHQLEISCSQLGREELSLHARVTLPPLADGQWQALLFTLGPGEKDYSSSARRVTNRGAGLIELEMGPSELGLMREMSGWLAGLELELRGVFAFRLRQQQREQAQGRVGQASEQLRQAQENLRGARYELSQAHSAMEEAGQRLAELPTELLRASATLDLLRA